MLQRDTGVSMERSVTNALANHGEKRAMFSRWSLDYSPRHPIYCLRLALEYAEC